MRVRYIVAPALAALCLAAPAMAQRAGTTELGVFGQYDAHMDTPWALQNGVGFGARLGWFASSRWEIEGDFATSSLNTKAPRPSGSDRYTTYAGRLMYNVPTGGNQFLLGAGVGGEQADGARDFVAESRRGAIAGTSTTTSRCALTDCRWSMRRIQPTGSLPSRRDSGTT